MNRTFRGITLLLAALFAAAACQAPRGTGQPQATGSAAPDFRGRPLNIVTGGTGGVYIIYGGGLANVLTNKMGVAAGAQSTTASVDNMKFIRDKKADLAFTLADTALDAVKGNAQFRPPETPAKALTLMSLYANVTHIVTKDGLGIRTVADLKGKRVSVGAPGSGTEVIATRVLEAYSLTQADLQPQKLGVQDSANGLRDGRLDAFFWSGGLPTAAVTDLANAPGIKLVFLDHADVVSKMAQKYDNLYVDALIPKGTYKNETDVKVSGVNNLLVVNADMEESLAYAIVKTMFESQKDLELVHPEAKNLVHEKAVVGSPIDYHPGAIRYYREKGVWKR